MNDVKINKPEWLMVDETHAHDKEAIAAMHQLREVDAAMDKAITATLLGGHRLTGTHGKGD